MASRLMLPQEENAIARGAAPNSQLRPMNLQGPGMISSGRGGRASPVNPYLDPTSSGPYSRVNLETGAGTFTGQPMSPPGGMPPGGMAPGGPPMNPQKEFWKGYGVDVLNMLGNQDTRPFQTGQARKKYAQQYNAGMTKPQIEYNKILYQRQKDEFAREAAAQKVKLEQDEKDWQTKMTTQGYIEARRNKEFDGSITQWLNMTPADRSKYSTGALSKERASSEEAFNNVVDRGMFDGDIDDWSNLNDTDRSAIVQMATRPDDFMSVEEMRKEYDYATYKPQSIKDAEKHNDPALLDPKVEEWKGNKEQIAAQSSMRKEYKREMAPIWSVQNSYSQTIAALNQATGAGDLAATVKFMKTLDPPSVVREGEQRMAQQVGGIKDQWLNTYEKWAKGDMLPATARAQLAAMSKALVMLTKKTRDSLREEYIYNAQQGYLDKQSVIGTRDFDYGNIPEYAPTADSLKVVPGNDLDRLINSVKTGFGKYFED